MNNIYIYEKITDKTVYNFMQEVNAIEDKENIVVYLCSDGGNPALVSIFKDIIERHQMRLVACGIVYSAALDLFLLTNTPRTVLDQTICLVHRMSLRGIDADKFGHPTDDKTIVKIWSEFTWDEDVARLFNMNDEEIQEMHEGRDFYFNSDDLRKALKKSEEKFGSNKK